MNGPLWTLCRTNAVTPGPDGGTRLLRRLGLALAILLAIAAPSQAWSLCSVNAFTPGRDGGTSPPVNTNLNCTTDLIVLVYAGGNPPAAVSDSLSNIWDISHVSPTAAAHAGILFAWNAGGGPAQTFTVTAPGAFPAIWVYTFSGSQTTASPFVAFMPGGAGGPTIGISPQQPGAITPPSGMEALFVTALWGYIETPVPTSYSWFLSMVGLTIDSGFSPPNVVYSDLATHYTGAGSYRVGGTSANPAWSWTGDAGESLAAMAAFLPAPAPPPPPPTVIVPSLVGLTQAQAVAALQAVGLVLGTVTIGPVIQSTPAAGAVVPLGSPVNVTQ
jgi:hypothetical protein